MTSRTRFGDERVAHVTEVHLEELQETLHRHFDELLTLQEAAELSGYSPRTLRRRAEDGELTNRGKKGAPLYRRGDLPRKVGRLRRRSGASQYGKTSSSQIVQRVLDSKEDDNG